MHSLTINYKNDSVKDKLLLFIKNFLNEDVEVTSINDIKDLLAIEEAKKSNEKEIPLEKILKEFKINKTK